MTTIDAASLKARLDAGEKLNLVDVREPAEHAEFNIGGQLVPLGQVQALQLEAIEDLKNEEVICYCRSGMRSMQASLMLEAAGFTNVKNLAGGMMGWLQQFGA